MKQQNYYLQIFFIVLLLLIQNTQQDYFNSQQEGSPVQLSSDIKDFQYDTLTQETLAYDINDGIIAHTITIKVGVNDNRVNVLITDIDGVQLFSSPYDPNPGVNSGGSGNHICKTSPTKFMNIYRVDDVLQGNIYDITDGSVSSNIVFFDPVADSYPSATPKYPMCNQQQLDPDNVTIIFQSTNIVVADETVYSRIYNTNTQSLGSINNLGYEGGTHESLVPYIISLQNGKQLVSYLKDFNLTLSIKLIELNNLGAKAQEISHSLNEPNYGLTLMKATDDGGFIGFYIDVNFNYKMIYFNSSYTQSCHQTMFTVFDFYLRQIFYHNGQAFYIFAYKKTTSGTHYELDTIIYNTSDCSLDTAQYVLIGGDFVGQPANLQKQYKQPSIQLEKIQDIVYLFIAYTQIQDSNITLQYSQFVVEYICPHECLTCVQNSPDCVTCRGDRQLQGVECICPSGKYDDNQAENCQSCPYMCGECIDSQNCTSCTGSNRESSPPCNCQDGYLDQGSANCSMCDYQCLKCQNQTSECIESCRGQNRNLFSSDNTCGCQTGYYDNNETSGDCLQCPNKCSSCSDANTCISCQGQFREDISSQCICNDGYYDDLVNQDCQECPLKCATCSSSSTCISCVTGTSFRQDINGNCDCQVGYMENGSLDCVLQTGPVCDIGNYSIEIINLDEILFTFDFEFNLNFMKQILVNVENFENYNGVLCTYIFDNQQLQNLGINPQCKIINDNNQSFVYLTISYQASYTFGDPINLQLLSLFRKDCLVAIQTLNLTNEVDLSQLPQPSIQIGGQTEITLCQDLFLYIKDIKNIGLKELQNIQWTIQGGDDQQLIDELNQTVFQQNYNQFNINLQKGTLQQNQVYQIEITFQNYRQQQGSYIAEINVLDDEYFLQMEFQQNNNNKAWQTTFIQGQIDLINCQNQRLLQQQIKNNSNYKYEIEINTMKDNTYKQIESNLKKSQIVNNSNIIQQSIEPYIFLPDTTYYIQIYVKYFIQNQQMASNQYNFEKYIKKSKLKTLIVGGNKVASYSQQLKVVGQYQDIDYPQSQHNPSDFTINWECLSLKNYQPCKNIQGQIITLDQQSDVQTYQKKYFQPYETLQFTLNVSKNNQSQKFSSLIVIIETDLPELSVNLPDSIQLGKINMNDEIIVNIDYSGNPDILIYNLVFMYKFDKVAIKQYKYKDFSFKVWNLFSDFQSDQYSFITKISVYDPAYFMPAENSFVVNINEPPVIGNVQINPDLFKNISLKTVFSIKCSEFFDIDFPLQYQYGFYLNQNDYEQDLNEGHSPTSFNFNLIQDFTYSNSIQTVLPQSNEDDPFIIIVNVKDSLGAQVNVTQTLNVESIQLEDFNQNYIQKLNEIQLIEKQQQKAQKLNILIQELRMQYKNDKDNNQIDFQELGLNTLNILNEINNQQISSQPLNNQIVKSKSFLQKIVKNTSSIQDVNNYIQNMSLILDNKLQELNDLLNTGQYLKGVHQQEYQRQNLFQSLGIYLQNIDVVLDKEFQVLKNRRLLREDTQINIEQINDLDNSINKIGQILNKGSLPNSDIIQMKGDQINVQMQVQSAKQTQKLFNFEQQPFQQFEIEEQQLFLYDENDNLFNLNSESMQDFDTTFNVNFKEFQDTHIMSQIEDFPYQNQVENGVQEYQIDYIDDNDQNQTLQSSVPLPIKFQSKKDPKSKKSDKEVSEENVCLQQDKVQQKELFKGKQCESVRQKNSDGQYVITCQCEKISKTTIVHDFKNLYSESKIEKVYSKEGLNAFVKFKFYKSVIFYGFVIITIIFIWLIILGYKKDKQQKARIQKNIGKISKALFQRQQDKKNGNEKRSSKLVENLNLVIDQMQNLENQQEKKDTPKTEQEASLDQQFKNQESPDEFIKKTKKFQPIPLLSNQSDNKIPAINDDNNNFLQIDVNDQQQTVRSQIRKNSRKRTKKNTNFMNSSRKDENQMNSSQQINNENQNNNNENNNLNDTDKKVNNFMNNSNQENKENNNNINNNDLINSSSSKDNNNQENNQMNLSEKINQNQEKNNTMGRSLPPKIMNQSKFARKNIKEMTMATSIGVQDQNQDEKLLQNRKFSFLSNVSEKDQIKRKESINLTLQQQENFKQQQEQNLKVDQSEKVNFAKLNKPKLNRSQYIWYFHEFFQIILVRDKKLSRPLKFILYYLKVVLPLSGQALFNNEWSLAQQIILGSFVVLLSSIPIAIIEQIVKRKNKFVKAFGIILHVLIVIFCYYNTITSAAVMGLDESNKFGTIYFQTVFIDIFGTQLFLGFIRIIIYNSFQITSKVFKLFINENIMAELLLN